MEKIRLGDYVEIDSGYAFKSNFFNECEGIPIIRIRDVTSGTISTYYSGEYDERYLVRNGDLLISMDGSFVVRKWIRGIALLNQRVCRIKSKDSNILLDSYIYHILPRYLKQIEDKTSFVTVKHLSVKDINEIELCLPSIQVQEKTIMALDRAKEVIEKRREQIEACDELIKSQFIEMFGDPVTNPNGWELKKCKDIASKIGSGATPKGGNASYKETGISLIRSMNVHNNSFIYKDLAYIDDEQADKLSNVVVEESDILLNITGASVARSCIVPKEVLPARVNQHVSIVRCKQDVIQPMFLCRLFTNESYQKLLWSIATSGGATREAITKQQEEELNVIVPPIEFQHQFAEFVKQVDKLKFEMEQSLIELENNFNSLMQRAFKGELF